MFTSSLNDREHYDKPKSQIGFYSFVCLPLFKAVARAIPGLRVNEEKSKLKPIFWYGNRQLLPK
jgi:hypothetical protein